MGAALTRSQVVVVSGGLAVLFGLAIGGGFVFRVHMARKRREEELERMKLVGHVKKLLIYPIKSCAPVIVEEADCSTVGLFKEEMRDRIFLITDSKYHFITGRQEPQLIFIKPTVKGGDILLLDAPGMETITIKLSKTKKEIKPRVWGVNVRGIDCGEEVSEWLSRFLNKPPRSIRLVYHPWETSERIPFDDHNWDLYQKKDTTIFGDLCPVLLINEASVTDLNTRVEKKITAQNFRPTVLVETNKAFEEDDWKYIKIGSTAVFRNIRPCTRCVFTTIDPETGVRCPEGEPLKTLKTYRSPTGVKKQKLTDKSPMFGVYLGLELRGPVRIGDPVFASS